MFSRCNYLCSLLNSHTLPTCNQPPMLINCWLISSVNGTHSPLRIQYGSLNPAFRGLIVSTKIVIPNFSWTPRLRIDLVAMEEMLTHVTTSHLVVLPSVHGVVVRIANIDGQWYVATNSGVEAIKKSRKPNTLLRMLDHCIRPYFASGTHEFLRDLSTTRVWFFVLYPNRPLIMTIGTCRHLDLEELREYGHWQLDLDFSAHQYIAPSVPILPDASVVLSELMAKGGIYDPETLQHTGMYDGLFQKVQPV
jgi:hypothetical protein